MFRDELISRRQIIIINKGECSWESWKYGIKLS